MRILQCFYRTVLLDHFGRSTWHCSLLRHQEEGFKVDSVCEPGRKLEGTYCLGEKQWMVATDSSGEPHLSSAFTQFQKELVVLLLDSDLAD